jgi:hypothetical protein
MLYSWSTKSNCLKINFPRSEDNRDLRLNSVVTHPHNIVLNTNFTNRIKYFLDE